MNWPQDLEQHVWAATYGAKYVQHEEGMREAEG